jgi:hypothetical protein
MMKGDFTRDTFNPIKHFTRVLMQQGRIQLDSDWNEQAAILLHYLRALAADLIGPFGGPRDNLGFGIFSAVVEKDPQAGELVLSKEESDRLKQGVIPADGKLPAGDFLISRGHYYVDGLLCENDDYVRYTGQSDLPSTKVLQGGGGNPSYLAYLDVWECHITYLEDDSIREVALGGPDTATRAKVVWQVKAFAVTEDDLKPKDRRKAINDNWESWVKRIELEKGIEPENHGQLKAKVKVPDAADSNNPCLTPPDARYRGAENQLYRVEIHRGGKPADATFKWSRENGSVVFPIVEIGSDTIKLAHLGRDNRQGLKVGDWVEIVSDEMVLSGTVPPLVQVDSIEPVDLTIRFKIPNDVKTLPSKVTDEQPLVLRRWDHKSDLKHDGAVQLAESAKEWLMLEDGVQIQFQPGGLYRTGDYWLIPARTATGNIEWPGDRDDPLAQPPHGIKHHYAPLAIVSIKGEKIDSVDDLRNVITPLGVKP